MAYYKYFRSTPKNLIYLKIYSFIKYYRRKIMRGNMQKNYLVENYGFSFSFKYYLVFNINITDSKKKQDINVIINNIVTVEEFYL